MQVIRNGTFTIAPRLKTRSFLAVVGVLTNHFVHSHVSAHASTFRYGVHMVYVSCVSLGYPNPVLLECTQGGLSQLEHTKLWLSVAPGRFPNATHICKADVDTLVFPRPLRRILERLPERSVWGRSCWVDPCLWGVPPRTPWATCTHHRRPWRCADVSHVSCGICGGFYALTYDIASAIGPRANRSSLRRFNENEEDRFASHLIQTVYGGDFWFASDSVHWETYTTSSRTRRDLAVLHGVKKKWQWSSLPRISIA